MRPPRVVVQPKWNVAFDNNVSTTTILLESAMLDRRYHHGDLRAALLIPAEQRLRTSGRGCRYGNWAVESGVSHGAPRAISMTRPRCSKPWPPRG